MMVMAVFLGVDGEVVSCFMVYQGLMMVGCE